MGLRAVGDDEKPPKKKAPKSVSEAVEDGTTRDQLLAMRARIAKAIDDPNIRGADLAALSRRLLEIGKDLEAIDAREQEDGKRGDVSDGAFDAAAV